MAVTVPTRTSGSLGTTKSDANPVTNEPQQLSAAQYNECADKLIEVINQSNANASVVSPLVFTADGISSSFDVDVTTLPAGDLMVRYSARKTTSTDASMRVGWNGLTNYTTVNLVTTSGGSTSTAGSGSSQNSIFIGEVPDADTDAQRVLNGEFIIQDYKNNARRHVLRGSSFGNNLGDHGGRHNTNDLTITELNFSLSAGGLFTVDTQVLITVLPRS